jgi:ATP:corrinoid adenosyltransferase
MKYIRDYYGVPAKRGARIIYTGNGMRTPGRITSAIGGRLRARLEGVDYAVILHPTWEVEYPEAIA